MQDVKQIKTTGQLRSVLASTIEDILNGGMDLNKATAIYKITRNISDSLFEETKMMAMARSAGNKPHDMGKMPIGQE